MLTDVGRHLSGNRGIRKALNKIVLRKEIAYREIKKRLYAIKRKVALREYFFFKMPPRSLGYNESRARADLTVVLCEE